MADHPHDHTKSNLNPTKDDGNVVGNLIGEGVGGASGIAAGAAIGALGGPVGMVVGALAGAVGGWWSGRAVSEAAHGFTSDDDTHYRTHYGTAGTTTPADMRTTRSYDDVRPAYQLGHLAGRNPDYANRSFDDVESDLRRGWTSDVSAKHGDWDTVRPYARTAYDRGRMGGAGATARGAMGTAAAAAGGLADRVGDKVDDLKDRVDGNPASQPGRDMTDRPGR
ncbi:hypothetical protein [Roseisolibacter sp. H3M3-2]|uniref:hypothetical protein n=1 Tax=Roseisolibacter sp. H3M3-2 TaxID=3031323 RepID=UPI0023D9CA86|nr:hypothetical protein [Roseisolibacter sp. H3M3-2]MDF1502961.1 hypothetical protein [Roseisolibacter sp. H3M3-2]